MQEQFYTTEKHEKQPDHEDENEITHTKLQHKITLKKLLRIFGFFAGRKKMQCNSILKMVNRKLLYWYLRQKTRNGKN